MSAGVDRIDRGVLALLGLLLLAAGGAGLALSLGGFGTDLAGSPVVPGTLRAFAAETPWFWWAAAAACLLVALLGLRWLLLQLRTSTLTRLDLTTDPRDGITVLHTGALTAAVEDAATAIRGVHRADARLHDQHGDRVHLAVALTELADIADVRAELETRLVPDLRRAAGADLPVDIDLHPGRARSSTRALR
ncbi:hypothetical protein ACWFNE_10235 [Cellulomonas sp. NPDC055163]